MVIYLSGLLRLFDFQLKFLGFLVSHRCNFHTNFNLLFNDAAVNLSFSFRTPSISCLELTVNQGLMCVSKRKKGKDRSVTSGRLMPNMGIVTTHQLSYLGFLHLGSWIVFFLCLDMSV